MSDSRNISGAELGKTIPRATVAHFSTPIGGQLVGGFVVGSFGVASNDVWKGVADRVRAWAPTIVTLEVHGASSRDRSAGE